MPAPDRKATLLRYLERAHDAVLWKLDGVGEYDARRPLTPTGTNLLGVVKHLAWVELEYFGEVFGRSHGRGPAPDPEVPNSDMYAEAHESRADIVDLFAAARSQAIATIEALELEAEGHVPWWGDANPVSLHQIAVHMIAELHRHLGHLDILREHLDGAVGYREDADNLPEMDADDWSGYVARLEEIARSAASSL